MNVENLIQRTRVSAVLAPNCEIELTFGIKDVISGDTRTEIDLSVLKNIEVLQGGDRISGVKTLPFTVEGETLKITPAEALPEGNSLIVVSGTLGGIMFAVTISVTCAADGEETFSQEVLLDFVGDGTGTPFDPSTLQGEIEQLQTDMAGKADGSVYKVGVSGEEGSEVQNVAKVHGHGVELSNEAVATGQNAVAEGQSKATGDYSHAEGSREYIPSVGDYVVTTASGDYSHAEGVATIASGEYSHAEGTRTTASGARSHAEGGSTSATKEGAHAEGIQTTASGLQSHAEGYSTTASGDYSHAEGNETTASGTYSHAEGRSATASGNYSHAEGQNTIASGVAQHVCGKYNIEDANGTYALIVGNGTSNARSNAFAIDWNGNLVLFNAGTPVVLTPAKLAQLIA